LKSKRKRTILRKVIEFSKMCNVGVHLIIHDAEFDKVIEYNSGTASQGRFTIKDALRALEETKKGQWVYKYFDDDSYSNLCKGRDLVNDIDT